MKRAARAACTAVAAWILGCGRTSLDDLGIYSARETSAASSSAASSSAASSGSGAGGASSSSSASTGGAGGSGGAPCLLCGLPMPTGKLEDPEQNELSGIVASLAHADTFYVHNDSGDVPRFFAINRFGISLATFGVTGAQAVDWEDIARGPCPAGTCVFLGDIGDNNENRKFAVVYRVTEPAVIASGSVAAEALPFTYPDGPHNAETLLVHPVTGAITVVTKRAGVSGIYVFPTPLTPGVSVVLKKMGTITPPTGIPLITGGDVHPQATGVLLRTYTDVFYYPMAPGETVAAALSGAACAQLPPAEPQGEGIGWLPSGDGFITVSEGAGTAVSVAQCPGP